MEVANFALGAIAALFVWTLVKAGSIGTSLWFALRFPNAARKIVQAHDAYPRTCFFVGLVDALLTLILVLVLFKTKVFAWLGLLLLLLFISACILAFGPAYHGMGRRLAIKEGPHARAKALIFGGILAEVVFWTPVIGQVLAAISLFRGLGALVIAVFPKRKRAAESDANGA